MVVNLSKLTSSAQRIIISVHRITTSARGGIGRSMGTSLHRGGTAMAGYLDDPEATEQVIRAVAAVGALCATLLRARNGGAGTSGYQHHRADAEQMIRDVSAVGALLALALRCPRVAGRAQCEPGCAASSEPSGGG